MEKSTDGLFDKRKYLIPFLLQNGECEADRCEPLPHLFQFLKPTAASQYKYNTAIGLYLAVYFRLARLTAIRSGETAFYSLICQLQTYAMSLLLARIFIGLLLDYFLSNVLSHACLPWELRTNSVSPSDRNLSICGLHSLIPLKYPSPSKNAIL